MKNEREGRIQTDFEYCICEQRLLKSIFNYLACSLNVDTDNDRKEVEWGNEVQ